MMWDDHEVRDGWGSQGDEALRLEGERWRNHYAAARRWFVGYQAMRNPLHPLPGETAERLLERMAGASEAFPGRGPELHFQFDWGCACTFFVMDLRSQRSLDQVIGDEQLRALETWLKRRDDRPRLHVLVSSIPLTLPKWVRLDPARWLPSRGDDVRDQWWSKSGRRQATRLKELLAERFSYGRDRLLILSGDVHYSEVRRLEIEGGKFIGHEVISSGLSQDTFIADLGRFGLIEDTIDRFRTSPLQSTSVSRYHGAGFAELFVAPRSDGPPSVEIQAHFGRACGGTQPRRPLDDGFGRVS
jgi:phosphodiesterase/alkaline phosphatase D-like protein